MWGKGEKFPISAKGKILPYWYTSYGRRRNRERSVSYLTREENMDYRRNCPYDAMGDFSVLIDEEDRKQTEGTTKRSEAAVPIQPITQYR